MVGNTLHAALLESLNFRNHVAVTLTAVVRDIIWTGESAVNDQFLGGGLVHVPTALNLKLVLIDELKQLGFGLEDTDFGESALVKEGGDDVPDHF